MAAKGRTVLLVCAALAWTLTACRGQLSDKPPIHPNPNMFDQERFDPQEANAFFDDGRADRPPAPGVIAREDRGCNPVLFQGKNPDGTLVLNNPRPITTSLLRRGQERFDIYCAPCHDRAGYGTGMVVRYPQSRQVPTFPPPTNYHDAKVRDMPDGQIFGVMTNGARTMPSYAALVPPEDRWAIVAYIRALERSRKPLPGDVPADRLEELKKPQ
jgi:mono/diheme cytochrome c family protein